MSVLPHSHQDRLDQIKKETNLIYVFQETMASKNVADNQVKDLQGAMEEMKKVSGGGESLSD